MKNLIMLLMGTASLFLSACSNLNNNFDCPMKSGVRCESLDEVNAQVDRGEIGQVTLKSRPLLNSYPNINLSKQSLFYKDAGYSRVGEPLRYGETVMHIWIAPYEDTADNYHQESDVYTIVKPGHWIGYPQKESSLVKDSV